MGVCRLFTSQQDVKSLGPGPALCELQTWESLKVYGAGKQGSGIHPKSSVHRGETEAQRGGGAFGSRSQDPTSPLQLSTVGRTPRPSRRRPVSDPPTGHVPPIVHLEPRRCQPGAQEHLGAFDFPVSSQATSWLHLLETTSLPSVQQCR